MNPTRYFAICLLASSFSLGAMAEEKEKKPFSIEPKMLQSDEAGKKALAVHVKLDERWVLPHGEVTFTASGTHSFDDDVIPHELMKASLQASLAFFDPLDCYALDVPEPLPDEGAAVKAPDGVGDDGEVVPPAGPGPINKCAWGYTTVGVQLGGEADHDFDNRNNTIGVSIRSIMPTISEKPSLRPLYQIVDFVPGLIRTWTGADDTLQIAAALQPALTIGLDTVDPKEDEARQLVLGSLDTYERASFELSITTPLARYRDGPVNLAHNYHYFREVDADDAIRVAGLHRSRMSSTRLMFPSADGGGVAFLGYTTGNLPFGVEKDSALEIGFQYKL